MLTIGTMIANTPLIDHARQIKEAT